MGGFGDLLGGLFGGGSAQSGLNELASVTDRAARAVATAAGRRSQIPDQSDVAIQRAKLMERRRQMGLVGEGSTWLTGARGDTSNTPLGYKTLLGE